MREIRTEIEITSPPTKVWRILTQFDNWKNWNPIINEASGVASLGSDLSIAMRGNNGKDGPKYMPKITIFEEPKSFRWRAKMMAEFLFTNDKVFELEETGSGTRLIHKELFSGMLVPLFWSKLNQGVPPMLKSMNDSLKRIVEKSSY
ncbi:MAG: SRPBCC domain-containing protein [Nitrospirae bacterium]|nr:SRPBCC domain-containing protein [Nitrospirota bacterium]MBI3594165.1 SRPBCC domain-containing protein [Nitrospirota bacterium]